MCISCDRYEVAVGNVPLGTQLRQFFKVSGKETKTVISNLDLSDQRQVR